VGRRRIEMFQFRQVLVRLRAGDTAREVVNADPGRRRLPPQLAGICRSSGGRYMPIADTRIGEPMPRPRSRWKGASSTDRHRVLSAFAEGST
jgi:hypothetical protein